MRIRPCLASDAAGIESLFQEFVQYLRSVGDNTDYRFSARQYLADGFGTDPAFRGLVAEDESGLAGYLLFSRMFNGEYQRAFYISDLYVRQSSRGRGIGRSLMDELRKIALAEGVARLSWSVHKENAGAIRFYESLGAAYSADSHVMHLDVIAHEGTRTR